MRQIVECIRLVPFLVSILFQIRKQKQFVRKNLSPILDKYERESDLSQYNKYKIVHYYSLGVVVMLGNCFCILRGKPLTVKERKSLTYMAAISTLYDDFFDQTGHSKQEIEKMTYQPESFIPSTPREAFFNELTNSAVNCVGSKELLDLTREKLLTVQWRSKKQTEKSAFSWDELKQNTMEKGGWSFLFYRSALAHQISTQEKTIIFKIGGVLQYSNDIFDIHKDYQDHIFTQANSVEDINLVAQDFKQEMESVFDLCKTTEYTDATINSFLQSFKLICARTLVALEQLQNLQRSKGGVFKMQELSRTELICDMEKPANLLRMVSRYLTLAKK